ncbi:hypothetical protein ACVWZK_008651 [Bradyrhizobium sp. GM0.4]
MRILLLSHSFNNLTQRLHVELCERSHEVSVELDIHPDVTRESVALYRPDLVIAPFLNDVWRGVRCLIMHPGPPGDRGPAALDWAILEGVAEWGVTVLQADGEFDAGPIWVHRTFPMRRAAKSTIYRNEVTSYAVEAVLEAIAAIEAGHEAPAPMASDDPRICVRGALPASGSRDRLAARHIRRGASQDRQRRRHARPDRQSVLAGRPAVRCA